MPSNTEIIDSLVKQIIGLVNPLRVILFGSAARGEAGPSSDLDILVVMPDGANRRRTAQYLYRELDATGISLDILVSTPSVLERHKDNIGLIYRTILHQGREIYAA